MEAQQRLTPQMDPGGDAHAADGPGPENHPKILVNENPEALTQSWGYVMYILQSYGWFIVAGIILALYLKSKLEPKWQEMKRKQEDRSYLNVDPVTARNRQEAMERARQKMQEEHDARAAKAAEDRQRREEEKRKERIEDWERHQRGGGYRSKYKPQDDPQPSGSQPKPKKTNTYRSSDYNPLTGMSSGTTYRPARRGMSGGG